MKFIFSRIADFYRESDKILSAICIFTTVFGCMAVFSATYYKESFRPLLVQIIGMLLGLAAAFVISIFDFDKIVKSWHVIGFFGLIFVLLTFFIGIAPEGTDDKAWIDLGFTTVQPSEFFKISFIVTFAAHLQKVKENINKPKYLLPVIAHGLFPVALIVVQGDFGSALVFAAIFFFMVLQAGLSLKYIAAGFLALAVASPFIYFFVFNEEHRERLKTMFDFNADIQGAGYQQWRGRVALANGGLTGQGYLNGDLTQAGVIPEGYNDFIFVTIGEELGFIGCMLVLLLLGAICLRCLRIAKICRKDAGKFICVGVFAMIFAQTVINVGMCVSVLPVIGVTLPFFSSGGTSLLAIYLGIGLVLNVYMHRNSRTIYLHDNI